MDYLHFHARLRPRRLAVTDLTSGRDWSYREFDALVAACATLLRQEGVAQGDRVACLSRNRAELIALHLACARLGAIFVPLNWRLSSAELAFLLDDCQPTLLFADELGEGLDHPYTDVRQLLAYCSGLEVDEDSVADVDLPSLMLYTSGTTGNPKGVLLSEKNITETAINFSLLGEVDEDSGFLCESPMFHVIGMVTSVRPALFCGARLLISDGFEPARTLERMGNAALRITHFFCVPQMALALRDVDGFSPDTLRGLKAVFTGGAPHPEPQIRAWLDDGLAIVDGYGMSEAGTVFGMPLDRALIAEKAGCVGIPTPRVEARIVDESGRVVAAGIPGELQLRGDNISCGYWNRDEDFRNALTADGWFCTGDVLVRDDDGFYRVTDRKKDMFISGGENVYPAEVEAQLLDFPGLREFTVVGVPDPRWGEVGCVFYVADGQEVDIREIETFLTPRLARYKIPKRIQEVSAIPRNGVGKVLKTRLRTPASAD